MENEIVLRLKPEEARLLGYLAAFACKHLPAFLDAMACAEAASPNAEAEEPAILGAVRELATTGGWFDDGGNDRQTGGGHAD